MTHPVMRSRAAAFVAAAGTLSLLLGAAALAVAPSASADQSDATHGKKGGDPPGNNGTVKIENADIQSLPPDNNPHQGCTFAVEFYNFDKGDYRATVTFEDKAPTADAGLQVVSGNLHPFIGEDAAGGGKDLDAKELYTLTFTGEPHPKQGYHVKLTVNAPGSIGNDTKHKVFWVKGCKTTPPTTPPTQSTPPTTSPTQSTPPTTSPTQSTPPTQPTDTPSTRPTDTPPASSPGESHNTPTGTPTATMSTPASDVSDDTSSPTVGVPTEVDAGFGGGASNSVASSHSPFSIAGGLLLAAGGLLLAGGGTVALRKRGRHSV